MKKTLLILGLLALPVVVFAQGTVNFANSSSTTLSTNVGPIAPPGQVANTSGLTSPAGQYSIGLYVAPAGTTDESLFTLVTPTALNQGPPVSNGRFNGGTSFVIPGNNGTPIAFQVRAWSVSGGSTYEAASAPFLYRGKSTIGSATPATGLGIAPQLFGTDVGQVGGFVLTPNIPEPSSIALGLLGLGAIALFRRRK